MLRKTHNAKKRNKRGTVYVTATNLSDQERFDKKYAEKEDKV